MCSISRCLCILINHTANVFCFFCLHMNTIYFSIRGSCRMCLFLGLLLMLDRTGEGQKLYWVMLQTRSQIHNLQRLTEGFCHCTWSQKSFVKGRTDAWIEMHASIEQLHQLIDSLFHCTTTAHSSMKEAVHIWKCIISREFKVSCILLCLL